jgi:hypothetical protein
MDSENFLNILPFSDDWNRAMTVLILTGNSRPLARLMIGSEPIPAGIRERLGHLLDPTLGADSKRADRLVLERSPMAARIMKTNQNRHADAIRAKAMLRAAVSGEIQIPRTDQSKVERMLRYGRKMNQRCDAVEGGGRSISGVKKNFAVAYVALKLNRSVRYIENLLAMPDLPASFENFARRNPSVYCSKRRKH